MVAPQHFRSGVGACSRGDMHHETERTGIEDYYWFFTTVVVRLRIIVRVMVRVKVRFWVGVRVRIMGTELMSHVSACETKSTKYR